VSRNDDKPPWPARSEADNHEMLRWLEWQLDEIQWKEISTLFQQPPFNEAERLEYAIECAESGDVELLRKELVKHINDPRIARFVNLPKLKQGERWTVNSSNWIGKAAADVPRIRQLWRKHYEKKQRRKSDGWSAERFAAEIWKVGVDQIERYLKKHSIPRQIAI
jgi:hypothetical protein